MRVTILRGISGCGKSTWAAQHASEAYIVSTDRYFVKDGVYTFDASKLATYHQQAFRDFLEAILRQEPWIVVDNTNILLWEFIPYVVAAQAYAYTVEIITLACSLETSLARKQLLAEQKLRYKLRDLDYETTHFPKQIAEIHRIIRTD